MKSLTCQATGGCGLENSCYKFNRLAMTFGNDVDVVPKDRAPVQDDLKLLNCIGEAACDDIDLLLRESNRRILQRRSHLLTALAVERLMRQGVSLVGLSGRTKLSQMWCPHFCGPG